MSNKKILIISRAFYPQNSPRSLRATELAKEFSQQGHQVTVVTKREGIDHSKFEEQFNVEINDIGKVFFKAVEINKHDSFLKRGMVRVLDYFLHFPNIIWMFKTKKTLQRAKQNYDLLVTVAVPHPIHWGAALASNINSVANVWAADCGDPFMLDKNDSFRKMFYFKFFEKLWCRKCDHIVVPFEGAVNGYYEEFREKIKIIPQGFSFPSIKSRHEKNDLPTFVYSGNIGSYRHYYEPFFELLQSIDIDFKFLVFTKEEEIYKQGLEKVKDKIVIHKYVAREELLKTLKDADFLIHFPYLNQQQKSLKLIDYNYVNKPILSYQGVKDNKVFEQFLKYDFSQRMEPENIDKFRIANVAKEFLALKNKQN